MRVLRRSQHYTHKHAHKHVFSHPRRYPPADAETFASKYVQGFYTYLEKAAPAKAPKSASAEEAGTNPMVAALAEL